MTRSDFLSFALAAMQELQSEISLEDREHLRWLLDFQVDVLLQEEKDHVAHGVWMSERVEAYREVEGWLKSLTSPQTHGFALYNQTYAATWTRVGGFSLALLGQSYRLLDAVSAAFIQSEHRSRRFRLRVFDVSNTGKHTQRDVHFQLVGVRRIHTAGAGIEEDTYRIHNKPSTHVALTANAGHWKTALGVQAVETPSQYWETTPNKRWAAMLDKLADHEVFPSRHAMQRRGNYLLTQPERIWMTWECDTTYEEAADKLVLLVETLRKENERPTP